MKKKIISIKQKKLKKPLLKKRTRIDLEGQIRLLTNDLNTIKRQLKRGVNREKFANKKFRGEMIQGVDREQQGADREKEGADRERRGADREKLGAGREKLAIVKFREQTNQIEIRDGQLRQGADRERLGANREKLAEEQIYIRTKAIEATFDGIFIIDALKSNFPIIYANPSFYELTGFTKNEVIGKNYFLLYGDTENLKALDEIKIALQHGKPFQGEMQHYKKNGEKFWSLLRISLVRDKDWTVTHYVGNKTDTTLMKQRNLEIEVQREELLHVTRVGKLAEFVSSLAHEISQPLTAILSYAQAAERMYKGREPQLQEILQYIINDDQRAAEVIRRLRYLLKKSKPSIELLNINILIKDTITLMMPHITAKDKVIKFESDSKLPFIQGDKIQLQQVILNLISNSLEAMESNKDAHELLISTHLKDANMVMVEVKDSGCGIPKENMDKLFGHFFTNKPDGLGMGLSISRSIVEAHGGILEAKNNSDRGATFYFTLPVNKGNDQ